MMSDYKYRGPGIDACLRCFALVSPSDWQAHDLWHDEQQIGEQA